MNIIDEYGAILIYEKFRYLTIPNFIYNLLCKAVILNLFILT